VSASKRERQAGGCKRRSQAERFYDSVVSEGDRVALSLAGEVDGLDQEIAMLRFRLRQTLAEHPDNLKVMLKAVELLVKALAANYRLSQKNKNELTGRMKELLDEFEPLTRLEAQGDSVAVSDN
jgi:hypothetical protein